MGRVRTKTVKRAGRQIIERFHNKLSCDFLANKKIADEVATIPSKRLRNKIAGFITHTMKRMKNGSVRGISIAVQQAESERRYEATPSVSVTEVEGPLEVDADTAALLQAMGVGFEFTLVETSDKSRDRKRHNRDRDSLPVGMTV